MKKVNLRIGELRRKRNITQQELAEVVGVSFHVPDIVNITLHFFLKDVRSMLPLVTKRNTVVA